MQLITKSTAVVKIKIIIFMAVAIVCITDKPIFAVNEPGQKGLWYMGCGIGAGFGFIDTDSEGNQTFNEYFNDKGKEINLGNSKSYLGLNIDTGFILTPHLHMGLDISALITQANYYDDSLASIELYNFNIITAYYPFKNGLSVRGGAGYTRCNYWVSYSLESEKADERNSASGIGILMGIGYDFNFRANFNMGLHADFANQFYKNDELNGTRFMRIYVAFYWF
ncbi:MAG: autotransporter domain-containing protein [Spirochaetes bacterium]|nr:autotransporter domain-containing protein [Spirochaetota bacterium]